MATSTDIKNRADALSRKTDSNSITPEEVGGLFYDIADLCEAAIRNGGTLGIRKVYTSISAMEADSTAPTDLWGNPMRRGSLCVIYDGTTTGTDNNKIFAFTDPGWQIATHLDAAYATREMVEGITGLDDYPVFSATKAYAAGDVVRYGDKLYKFTADHAAGAWTGTDVEDWNLKKSDDFIKSLAATDYRSYLIQRLQGKAADSSAPADPFKWLDDYSSQEDLNAALDALHNTGEGTGYANSGSFRGTGAGMLFFVENTPLSYANDQWLQSVRGCYKPAGDGLTLVGDTEGFHIVWRKRTGGAWGKWRDIDAGAEALAAAAQDLAAAARQEATAAQSTAATANQTAGGAKSMAEAANATATAAQKKAQAAYDAATGYPSIDSQALASMAASGLEVTARQMEEAGLDEETLASLFAGGYWRLRDDNLELTFYVCGADCGSGYRAGIVHGAQGMEGYQAYTIWQTSGGYRVADFSEAAGGGGVTVM